MTVSSYNWNNLPLDLQLSITAYQDPNDAITLTGVNKHWRKVRDQDPFWKQICQRIIPDFESLLKHIPHPMTFKECFLQLHKIKVLRSAHSIQDVHPHFYSTEKFRLLKDQVNVVYRDQLHCYSTNASKGPHKLEDVGKQHAEWDGIGFFGTDDKSTTFVIKRLQYGAYFNNPIVRLINLEKGVEISCISLTDALTPSQKRDVYLYSQSLAAIFLLDDHQFITLSSKGTLAYWDMSDIAHPKHLKSVQILLSSDQRNVVSASKQDNLLVIYEHQVAAPYNSTTAWLRVFDLETQTSIQDLKLYDIATTLSLGVIQGSHRGLILSDKTFVNQQTHKVTGYQIKDKKLVSVWENTLPPSTYLRNSIHSSFPYLLLVEQGTTPPYIEEESFTIWDARDGSTIISKKSTPPPCKTDADCLQVGSHCYFEIKGKFSLKQDTVIRTSEHQIDMWTLPFGSHQIISMPTAKHKINEDGVRYTNHPVASWDGSNLFLKYVNHPSSTSFRSQTLEVYKPLPIPPTLTSKPLSIDPPPLPPLTRTHFVRKFVFHIEKLMDVNMQTLWRSVRFVILFDFWAPRWKSLTFTAKILKASYCLRQIIEAPLLTIGIQFAIFYAILSPHRGERVVNFMEAKFNESELRYNKRMTITNDFF